MKEHYLTMKGSIHLEKPSAVTEPLLLAPAFITQIAELPILNYVINSIGSRRTFVDVGAHIGFYAIPLAYHFERVIAYEPSKIQYGFLQKNMDLNSLHNLTHKYCAVGARNYRDLLYVMGRSGGSNTMDLRVAAAGNPMESYEVNVVALDNEDLVDVDLIKIDVEGLELDVLIGAKQCIERYKPTIILEVWDEKCRRAEVARFLETLGYTLDFMFPDFPELAISRPNTGF